MSIFIDWAREFYILDEQVDSALNTIANLQVEKLLNIEHRKLTSLIDIDKKARIVQYFKDNLENFPDILYYLPTFIEYGSEQGAPLYCTDEVAEFDDNEATKRLDINTIYVTEEDQVLKIYTDYLKQAT